MLVGEGQEWPDGEEQAWSILSQLRPEDVCRRAQVDFDGKAGHYIMSSFKENVFVAPKHRRIWGDSRIASLVANELYHYFGLSALWYLVQAKDIGPSGNLINPREVSGGMIFAQGSHVLPLDRLVQRYANDVDGFICRALAVGSERLNYGDCSVRLFPFPRVPVELVIWNGDEEFPARANILFDSTCSVHLPTDIIWSTAMVGILVMLK